MLYFYFDFQPKEQILGQRTEVRDGFYKKYNLRLQACTFVGLFILGFRGSSPALEFTPFLDHPGGSCGSRDLESLQGVTQTPSRTRPLE